jgi:hypothetical protein
MLKIVALEEVARSVMLPSCTDREPGDDAERLCEPFSL